MTRTTFLALLLGLVIAFSLAASLDRWHGQWEGSRTKSESTLDALLGEGRRMFATHFFVKADAYFHSGYYPSIFDQQKSGGLAITGDAGLARGGHNDISISGPRDFIERFGRNFAPNVHKHLDEAESAGQIREILPWLRMTAALDPERIDAYTVAAFWLRKRLGKIDEAEEFLRDGLRANPGDYQILFELGRIYDEDRNDPVRARNVWEAALRNWHRSESGKEEPNLFLLSQIVAHLALLAEREGNIEASLQYLELLKSVSPNPGSIDRWMLELRKQLTQPSAGDSLTPVTGPAP